MRYSRVAQAPGIRSERIISPIPSSPRILRHRSGPVFLLYKLRALFFLTTKRHDRSGSHNNQLRSESNVT